MLQNNPAPCGSIRARLRGVSCVALLRVLVSIRTMSRVGVSCHCGAILGILWACVARSGGGGTVAGVRHVFGGLCCSDRAGAGVYAVGLLARRSDK